MSNKGKINLNVFNESFKLYFNSNNKLLSIAKYQESLVSLDEYCKSYCTDGFELVVESESRMRYLELILRIVEHLSSNMKFLSEFEVNSMLLVINEALSNAVYHGNLTIPQNFRSKSSLLNFEKQVEKAKPDELRKKVILTVNITKEYFEITVKDNGKGFDFEKRLNKSAPPSPEEESGRGIYILKNSVDFIKFSNKGRTLVMKKEWRNL